MLTKGDKGGGKKSFNHLSAFYLSLFSRDKEKQKSELIKTEKAMKEGKF